jgi:hypothetical protein
MGWLANDDLRFIDVDEQIKRRIPDAILVNEPPGFTGELVTFGNGDIPQELIGRVVERRERTIWKTREEALLDSSL